MSNRSAAYAKAKMWKEALEDADSCVSLNEKFDKGKAVSWHDCFRIPKFASVSNPHWLYSLPNPGYARKAGALMGMGNYKDALKVCKVP